MDSEQPLMASFSAVDRFIEQLALCVREVTSMIRDMSTTAAKKTDKSGVDDPGLAGVMARFRRGGKSGFGIFHPGSWAMLIGGMMMIFSAFLPWVYVNVTQEIIGESFILRGTDGPGVITLSVGCVAFAGGFIPKRRLAIAHAAVPGIVVAAITGLQFWNIITASIETQWGSFMPGMGLVLAAGGAVMLLRAAWRMYKQWPAPQPSNA